MLLCLIRPSPSFQLHALSKSSFLCLGEDLIDLFLGDLDYDLIRGDDFTPRDLGDLLKRGEMFGDGLNLGERDSDLTF